MSKMTNSLGAYAREVFDLNKDGHVSFKEILHTLVPSQAVGIALIVVDLLAMVGEYRVWQVGLYMSQGDAFKAVGYVAVSLVPFYLAQILWLYPLATGWQQGIAVLMGLMALITSVNFGLADLTQHYDVVFISKMVVFLWLAYILMLLAYVLVDKQFRLLRMKITAKKNTEFQRTMNNTTNELLQDLEQSLQYEQRLRDRFGDDAVEAHIQMLRGFNGKKTGKENGKQPALPPANPQEPPSQNQSN